MALSSSDYEQLSNKLRALPAVGISAKEQPTINADNTVTAYSNTPTTDTADIIDPKAFFADSELSSQTPQMQPQLQTHLPMPICQIKMLKKHGSSNGPVS